MLFRSWGALVAWAPAGVVREGWKLLSSRMAGEVRCSSGRIAAAVRTAALESNSIARRRPPTRAPDRLAPAELLQLPRVHQQPRPARRPMPEELHVHRLPRVQLPRHRIVPRVVGRRLAPVENASMAWHRSPGIPPTNFRTVAKRSVLHVKMRADCHLLSLQFAEWTGTARLMVTLPAVLASHGGTTFLAWDAPSQPDLAMTVGTRI